MKKVKEFLSSPKKMAILGLISSIILLLYYIFNIPTSIIGILLNYLDLIGLTVYFTIVCIRMDEKNCNIKVANYILIASFLIKTVLNIVPLLNNSYARLDSYNNYFINTVVTTIINIITILYLYNILLKKTKLINNKVFALATIIYVVYLMIQMPTFSLIGIFLNLCILARIPYFYNYHELLKKENNITNQKELQAMGIIEEQPNFKKNISNDRDSMNKEENGIISGREKYEIFVLVRNKAKYLEIAKKEFKEEDYLKLEKKYLEFIKTFQKYRYDVMEDALNRVGQNKALQEHKINPYIASGAGQAIGGIGGGIYAGISSANRNSRIDENRKHWANEVIKSNIICSSSKIALLSVTEELDRLLNLSSEISKDREEAELEEQNKEAEENRKKRREKLLPLYVCLGAIGFIFIAWIFLEIF